MGGAAVDSASGMVAETRGRTPLIQLAARLVKEKPLGAVGGVVTLLLLLTGVFADVLAPSGMNETNMEMALSAPSAQFLLGTDELGRDMLSRLIYGARISVIIGLSASGIGVTIAVILGMMSGYSGGKVDLIVQRLVDAVMCMPGLILLMVILSLTGPGVLQVILVLGIREGIVSSRVVRSAVISVKHNTYVQAAKALGCSTPLVLARHILPNIVAPVIILFTTRLPGLIMTEASLSFLGFGVPPPVPSWGGMLSGTGRTYMFRAPWMAIWPGLALSIVVYGVNMFGDALRDMLDPRLKGGVGRYGVRVERRK
jgi:peptide/nickel transport system permease protein